MSQPAEKLQFTIGIFPGISNAYYHADKDSYSSSLIKKMPVPAEAKYAMDNPGEYKDCFRMGGAIHKYVLEREDFEKEFLTGISCSRRKGKDANEWAAWFIEHGADGEKIIQGKAATWNGEFEKQTGKHMVTPEEITEIQQMAEAVMANKNARRLLESGAPEQSVYWTDPETGLQLRCRPDYLNAFCSDLKSIKDVTDHTINNQIHRLGYNVSAAMYQDGLQQVTGTHHPFVFIFANKEPPYFCRVFVLDDIGAEIGWKKYQQYKRLLAECLDKGEWPGYGDDLETSITPFWAEKESENGE